MKREDNLRGAAKISDAIFFFFDLDCAHIAEHKVHFYG